MTPAPSTETPLVPRLRRNASIKVIGLGGTGSIAARYGATFLASLGTPARLTLIDGDVFEPGNATRMLFLEEGNKASVVCRELQEHLARSALLLAAVEEYVTPENVGRLIHDGDVVLLTVDNHATRKLVSDHCATTLRNVCLISGGNDGVEAGAEGRLRREGTYGNVQIHVRRGGRDRMPPLTAFHPEIREPADRSPAERSCTEAVASTPQLLFANLQVASAILSTLWLYLCGALDHAEVCFDIRRARMAPLDLPVPAGRRRGKTRVCPGA